MEQGNRSGFVAMQKHCRRNTCIFRSAKNKPKSTWVIMRLKMRIMYKDTTEPCENEEAFFWIPIMLYCLYYLLGLPIFIYEQYNTIMK